MAKIEFISQYQAMIQAQPEKKFTKDGKDVIVAARPAGVATRVLARYEESIIEFILPESFSTKPFGLEKLSEGDILTVRCPELEKIKPLNIWNVDCVTSGKKK